MFATIAKKSLFFVLVGAALISCGGGQNASSSCKSKESCLSDPNCQCWCSQICGFRKKEASDKPVYIADDPNQKYCYCNQWDYDHYEDNCIMHKGVKESGK
jgi:hypothetical protein